MRIEDISRAAGKPVSANMRAVVAGLEAMGDEAGLDRPHRLAHFLSQLMHESVGFVHDREVWGPTPAQKRYEGRKDLGNTQPGDGRRFSGRGPIQITGRSNYRQFTEWCRQRVPNAPDFEANPNLVNSDPWEGIGPIWYWTTRNINALADDPGCLIETITRRINGGVNGLADRRRYFSRTALVMIGLGPADVAAFQAATPGLVADGISGQLTERALQRRLMAEPAARWAPAVAPSSPPAATLTTAEPDLPTIAALVARVDALERRVADVEAR